MRANYALLLTDLVDSTALAERLGEEAAAAVWSLHDRISRDLLLQWNGREVDRTDGFLWLFDGVDDAVDHALAYHRALGLLNPPLSARAGLHYGSVLIRANSEGDVALGAKRFDVEGIAVATVARLMSLAMGGQTLLSANARAALTDDRWRVQCHGHWRLKGLSEPVELFEVAAADAPLTPPPDSAKAHRVVIVNGDWVAAHDVPNNLPAERDVFVGRRDALQAIFQHFEGGARLVTVLGIGGIGKTRLALRHARLWLGDYPGGAWFCDLSQATSVDGIVQSVGNALGVPPGKSEPVQQLGSAIAGRGSCLVILDNFEQVSGLAEQTLGAWLERAPQALFIATSQILLGIAGEHALTIVPLSTEAGAQLFRERIQAAGTIGSFGEADEAAIPKLIEMLDGLPLAIELAAARAQLMPPTTMLERMSERFKLLRATGSGRRDRQATLRATLDWSWDLLSGAEQSALAQMSAFEGGFTLDAAEAVVDLASIAPNSWTADVVQSLVERSLVRRGERYRLGMLRTVQDYAKERFAAHEQADQEAVLQRHWQYFATIDEAAVTADRCVELGNVVAACKRAAATDAEHAVGALTRAWAALRLTGPFRLALGLVHAVGVGRAISARQQAAIDRVMGGALSLLGDAEGALARYQACLAQTAADDLKAQAQTKCLIADLEMGRGQYQAAEASLSSAMELARRSRDESTMIRVMNGLGALHLRRSELEPALQRYREALTLSEAISDRRWQAGLHGNLGTIAQMQGRLQDAQSHYSTGLAMAVDVGDRQWEGNMRCNFGLLLHELGNDAAARIELEAALQAARSIGHRRLEATALCNLGIVTESLGERVVAIRHYAEAVATARDLADARLEGQFRGYWGLLLARLGKAGEAKECLDLGEMLLTACNDPASFGALYCQQAMAAALCGDKARSRAQLELAEAVLETTIVAEGSELGQTLAQARRLAGR